MLPSSASTKQDILVWCDRYRFGTNNIRTLFLHEKSRRTQCNMKEMVHQRRGQRNLSQKVLITKSAVRKEANTKFSSRKLPVPTRLQTLFSALSSHAETRIMQESIFFKNRFEDTNFKFAATVAKSTWGFIDCITWN